MFERRDVAHAERVGTVEQRTAAVEQRIADLEAALEEAHSTLRTLNKGQLASIHDDAKIVGEIGELRRGQQALDKAAAELAGGQKGAEAGATAGSRSGAKWAALVAALGIAARLVEWWVAAPPVPTRDVPAQREERHNRPRYPEANPNNPAGVP